MQEYLLCECSRLSSYEHADKTLKRKMKQESQPEASNNIYATVPNHFKGWEIKVNIITVNINLLQFACAITVISVSSVVIALKHCRDIP